MRCVYFLFNVVLLSQNIVNAFLEDYTSLIERQSNKHCVCVPFWQCKEDFSGIDGDGINIMDIRTKIIDQHGSSACTGYFDVCCKVECGISDKGTLQITASQEKKTRILGEHNTADFGEFPWMLGILKGRVYKCGGSLIHPQVAMTAAHCVMVPGKYKVRAGEWNWEQTNEPLPHQDRDVENIVIHPKFHAGSLRNDIALLVLDKPFKLTRNVGIICVPPRNFKVDIKRCIVSGWGRNSFKKRTYQPVLKKVNLPIITREKCTTILRTANLGPFFTLHGSFVCAGGDQNKDTCKGDGGSPLICPVIGQNDRYEQVGIVSWGLTCGMANTPGVYVNVVIFSDWIDEEMIKLNLDTDIYRHY